MKISGNKHKKWKIGYVDLDQTHIRLDFHFQGAERVEWEKKRKEKRIEVLEEKVKRNRNRRERDSRRNNLSFVVEGDKVEENKKRRETSRKGEKLKK